MTTRQTAALLAAGCVLIAIGAGLSFGPGVGVLLAGLLLICWTLVVAYGSAASRAAAAEPSPVDRGVARRRLSAAVPASPMPDLDDADDVAVEAAS